MIMIIIFKIKNALLQSLFSSFQIVTSHLSGEQPTTNQNFSTYRGVFFLKEGVFVFMAFIAVFVLFLSECYHYQNNFK